MPLEELPLFNFVPPVERSKGWTWDDIQEIMDAWFTCAWCAKITIQNPCEHCSVYMDKHGQVLVNNNPTELFEDPPIEELGRVDYGKGNFLMATINNKKSSIRKKGATIFLKIGTTEYKVLCEYDFDSYEREIFDGVERKKIKGKNDIFKITWVWSKTRYWQKKFKKTPLSKVTSPFLNAKLPGYIQSMQEEH